jgi:hypothetical protein
MEVAVIEECSYLCKRIFEDIAGVQGIAFEGPVIGSDSMLVLANGGPYHRCPHRDTQLARLEVVITDSDLEGFSQPGIGNVARR